MPKDPQGTGKPTNDETIKTTYNSLNIAFPWLNSVMIIFFYDFFEDRKKRNHFTVSEISNLKQDTLFSVEVNISIKCLAPI